MASSLTVITSNAGVSTSKTFGAGADAGTPDVFAALLGPTGQQSESKPAAATTDAANPANAINLSLGFEENGADQGEDLEAIAAAIDATVPIEMVEPAVTKLTELAQDLADLKARLAAGEPLDEETLAGLEAGLELLARQLGIDLTELPTPEELAALFAGTEDPDGNAVNQLTAALGPLANSLLQQNDPNASVELSAQIKSLGDKLAALLLALNQGEVADGAIGELEASMANDLDLKAAMERLLKPAVTIAAETTPTLATPELKLTEPALTGKADLQATAPADSAGETADAPPPVDAADDRKQGDRDGDARSSERKADAPAAPVAAAATDKPADTQIGVQPVQAARVDAVAAPRVVQAGYQTSQQQLNLPQLAFEVMRQVNDGNTRFQIRLDPAELGKIDVRLDIDASGQVNARLTVEKAETLDLMQRDQRGLERALQQAGLDGAKTNLEFSLKQNPFSGGEQGRDGNGRPFFGDEAAAEDDVVPPTVNLYRGNLSASGVNIIA